MNVRERLIVAGFVVLGGTSSLLARSAGAPQGVTRRARGRHLHKLPQDQRAQFRARKR